MQIPLGVCRCILLGEACVFLATTEERRSTITVEWIGAVTLSYRGRVYY